MKLLDEIKNCNKEFVFDNYTRIVEDYKDYEKITKVKMAQEICKVYEDYNNIIDICTTRELKYLKMYFNNNTSYKSEKYSWERQTLASKFIIHSIYRGEIDIYEEIYDNVKEAVLNANLNTSKEKDEINEFLVSYCKVQGSCLLFSLVQISGILLDIEPEKLFDHIYNNRVFKYYVSLMGKYDESFGKEMPVLYFNDYYFLLDDLDEERKKQGRAYTPNFNLEDYKCLFYNDFNINNKTIKKFYEKLKELPFFWFSAVDIVKESALLNKGRESLKEAINSVPALKSCDLTDFFNLMDKAMDEMASGALNGLTPNELKKIKLEEKKQEEEMKRNFVRQKDAHLNGKDADLFYKLFFGILDFTNQKYKIKKKFKIYKQEHLNPADLVDIVDKLFDDSKERIIDEFCTTNPYKFNEEELTIVRGFKNGIRGEFILARYEEEYTAIMSTDKTYMIKGLNSNIDEVIDYDDLPEMVRTTLLPFKGYIVYDGMLNSFGISLGLNFKKMVNKEYARLMKYYHL